MHIRKRGDKWCAIIEMEKDSDGNRKQKWVTQKTGETKKAWEDRARSIEIKVHKGEYFESSGITVKDYLDKWLVTHCKGLSPKTEKCYREILDNHVKNKIGKIPLNKLKPMHIQDMYSRLGNRTDTIIYIHTVLHTAFKSAVKWQMLKYNPVDAVTCPKKKRKPETKVWPNDTINDFIDREQTNILYLPVVLAASTGMRRGEICGLTWDCINYEEQSIQIKRQLQRVDHKMQLMPTKTHRSDRPVKVSKEIIDLLKVQAKIQKADANFWGDKYCKEILSYEKGYSEPVDNNLVCRWQDGRPIIPDYISKYFPIVAKRLGLPRIKFHALRHSHATELLRSGIDILIISRRLGHSNISMTADIYSHVDLDMQDQAANVIKINKKKQVE